MGVKIFIVCHKDCRLPDADIYEPVAVGGGEIKELLKNKMLSDDEGDNIADKNNCLNEMTAVYWVWKNIGKFAESDYIGFTHYRRYFVFNDGKELYYEFDEIDKKCEKLISSTDTKIENLFKNCDFIAPAPAYRKSVYENYAAAHREEDLLLAIDILKELSPEFTEAAEEYLSGNKNYFFNAFIFDKATFLRYCEWIFPILDEFLKRRKHDGERIFVSERLTGIFFTELVREGKSLMELPTVFIRGKKESFKSAVKRTKENLRKKDSGIIYAFKPMISFFLPRSLYLKFRRKQYKRVFK